MRIGTKSVLFGIHNPLIHSYYMCKAWIQLHGISWELLDPRLHACFLLHDIGYWGCETMDGADGELHPIRGAAWVRALFGGEWADLCLYHSGTMVEIENIRRKQLTPIERLSREGLCLEAVPSKLYAVDKLASPLYPAWLYRLLSGWSGEWKEYAEIHYGMPRSDGTHETMHDVILIDEKNGGLYVTKEFEWWHVEAMKRMKARALQQTTGKWMTMKEAVKKEL